MRDLIDSILIGGCASYLPFWIWNNTGDDQYKHSIPQSIKRKQGVQDKRYDHPEK